MQSKHQSVHKISKIRKLMRRTGRKLAKTRKSAGDSDSTRADSKYVKREHYSNMSTQQSTISSNDSLILHKNKAFLSQAERIASTSQNFVHFFANTTKPFYTFTNFTPCERINDKSDDEFDFFIEDCIARYKDKGFASPDPLYTLSRTISGHTGAADFDISSDEMSYDHTAEFVRDSRFMF